MDSIATRYARALYAFARDKGLEINMYEQMKQVIHYMDELPGMHDALINPAVDSRQKAKLLLQMGGNKPSEEFSRFVELLRKNDRMDHIAWIARMYLDLYRKDKNIHEALLTVSDSIEDETTQKIFQWLEGELGGIVELKVESDPDLIGGFVLEADGKRWDSSLRSQLKLIHRELTS